MKIDLHVHTRHSRRPANWLLQKMGCPESYTDPRACTCGLRRLGMTHITFTDHNCIDGCLEVAGLPGTFISEEITAYFPDDRCKVHILAYDINEAIHREIQEYRENIFELVPYLIGKNVPHAIAHPFSAVNDRFQLEHFERLLLLFRVFELNGDQEREVNDTLRLVLQSCTPALIDRLAEKHRLAPLMVEPWRKSVVAGSDDHAGIAYGESHTRVGGAQTIRDFFAGVEEGRSQVMVSTATPESFGASIYSVAYRYLKDRFRLERYSGGDTLLRFLDATLCPREQKHYGLLANLTHALGRRRSRAEPKIGTGLTQFIRERAARLILENPELAAQLGGQSQTSATDGRLWFQFVSTVANQTAGHFAASCFERLAHGELFDLFHTIGGAGTLYLALAPYFVAYPFHAAERRVARSISGAFVPATHKPVMIGWMDESPDGTSPVRTPESCPDTLLRMQVVACRPKEWACPEGAVRMDPVTDQTFAELGGFRLLAPPFLQLLDYCYERDLSRLHVVMPGPMALSSLGIARLLGLPITVEYGNTFSGFMQRVGAESGMEDVVWRYAAWLCNQTDGVFAFSDADGQMLARRGVHTEKIHCLPPEAAGHPYHRARLEHWSAPASASAAPSPVKTPVFPGIEIPLQHLAAAMP